MTTQHSPDISDIVAENVRVLMARTRTRQQALAAALEMTQGAVSKKVNGDRPFTLHEVDLIARYFGVSVQSLFDPPQELPFPRGVNRADEVPPVGLEPTTYGLEGCTLERDVVDDMLAAAEAWANNGQAVRS